MSLIWKFFTIEDQADEIAECQLCEKGIRRGSVGCLPKYFSTTPLHKHMKARHKLAYEQGKEKALNEDKGKKESAVNEGSTPKQRKLAAMGHHMSIEESLNKKKYWDINDHRSMAIHQKVMNMIAVDNQPFIIAEDQGFIELLAHIQPNYMLPSRRYFSDVMLANAYDQVKARLACELEPVNAPYLSFTSDIWTSQHSVESFVSLTAHWINKNFERRNAVLNAKHFPGSHTGGNIEHMISNMMTEWGISEERQHILVRDGAANMALGIRLASISSVHCFLHQLDLVVRDSILSQRTIIDLCAKVRRICTHFNHSSLARGELKILQAEQGVKLPLFPVQDVATRWNSTYLMLERGLALKRSIQIYTANHDIPILSANEWNLLEKLLRVLQPFFEITKQVSSELSSLGDVIPHVVALDRYLSKQGNDSGVQTTKTELRKALHRRLLSSNLDHLDVKNEKNYVLTTVVDPRYKFRFLNDSRENEKKWLLEEIHSDVTQAQIEITQQGLHENEGNEGTESADKCLPNTSGANQKLQQGKDANIPKTLKEEIHCDFLRCYDETDDEMEEAETSTAIIQAQRTEQSRPSLSELANEVERYSNRPILGRDMDPVKFWKDEQFVYPNISRVARRYLSCPASSVYSERLFSEAGNVFEDHRARLLPRTGERLLFLHHNLPRFPLTQVTVTQPQS